MPTMMPRMAGGPAPIRRQATLPSSIELLERAEVPLRHPWQVAIPFVLVLSAAVAACFILPKRYRSSTLILVESERVPDAFVTKMATERTAKRLQTIRQEILSRTRLEEVLAELKPYPTIGHEPLTESVERLRLATEISVKESEAFTISFVHKDPEMAQKVASRLATLFIGDVETAREEQVKEAYQFIDSQLADARKELDAREAALRRYKESHMGTLPEQLGTNVSTLQRLQMEQSSTTESLKIATERLSMLETRPAQAARNDSGAALGDLQKQLVALRSRYTDEHPDVKALLARIRTVERQMSADEPSDVDPAAAMVKRQIEDARVEVERLKRKLAETEQRTAELQTKVDLAPRTEADIATLSRDFQKLNENYLALLNKKLDAQMATKLEERWRGEQFRILDPANLPDQPFFPNRKLFVLIGVVLGLGIGLGAAFVADMIDPTIKSVRDVEELLPYTVLAVLPAVGRKPHVSRGGRRPSGPSGPRELDERDDLVLKVQP
jgi:polysaccharide chain length determinant protein (PEP-CTERM system associated)